MPWLKLWTFFLKKDSFKICNAASKISHAAVKIWKFFSLQVIFSLKISNAFLFQNLSSYAINHSHIMNEPPVALKTNQVNKSKDPGHGPPQPYQVRIVSFNKNTSNTGFIPCWAQQGPQNSYLDLALWYSILYTVSIWWWLVLYLFWPSKYGNAVQDYPPAAKF